MQWEIVVLRDARNHAPTRPQPTACVGRSNQPIKRTDRMPDCGLHQHPCRLLFELLVGSLEVERFFLNQVGCIHSAGDSSPQFHFPLRRRGQFDQHFHLMHDRR